MDFKKEALLERLVRLAATDVPGTPRAVMKHRSPEELAALQHSVSGAFQKWEEPAKKAVHGVIDRIPHAGAQRVLKGGANMMIENPEMIPMQAIPIPGASLGYLGAKKGLERGLDRIAPIHKTAFSTNAFSGAMNPTIATGASDIPAFRKPSLSAPVQKVAFKLEGHDEHQGLRIAVENKPGSVRKGTTPEGKKWRTVMKNAYGYIMGTHGADGEDVDCYLGPHEDATHAHVVHQHKPDGKGYDEDKVMLGFKSKEDAKKAYLAHYDDPKFLGPIHAVPMDRFKKLLESDKKLVKISASSPTRGGFLLASDIPAFKSPSLSAPVEKTGDMLPDYVSTNDGVGFKRSKYAKDSCHAKTADISPTSPLGNGGGNPHRAQSDLPAFRGANLRTPLTKVSEFSDVSTYNGGPSSAGRGPVNEAGFRQAGDQPGIPVNSLRAPLIKRGSFGISANPMGAAHASKMVGKTPMLKGAPGPDIAKITKPPGKGFGGPLPGATKAGVGAMSVGGG